jgi:hypothetical protein
MLVRRVAAGELSALRALYAQLHPGDLAPPSDEVVRMSHAWAEGCYKVMLLTSRRDDATLRFYEAVGFDRNAKQGFVAKPAL